MLSTMENFDATLRSADNAAATPFIQTPRIPVWYPLAMAAYFAAVFGAFLLIGQDHIVLGAGLLLLSVSVVLVQTLIIRGRWGAWPRMSEAPAEIKRVFVLYLFLAVAAGIVSVTVWSLAGDVSGLITVFLTALTVVWAYEFRLYPAAARRVRQRLA